MKNFILCSVQRAGKTWIADTLRRLGIGHGLELLTEFERGCAPNQDRLAAAMQVSGIRGFLDCFSEMTHRDGFRSVGISIQWSNLHTANPETVRIIRDIKSALAPSIIFFIRRRDILGQTISHFLMINSGYAHSSEADKLQNRRALVPYDRETLEKSLYHIQGSYTGWDHLFGMADIRPATLYYEDFVDRSLEAFGDLTLQITGARFPAKSIALAASGLRKISDATDETIRRLYLAGN